MPKKVILDVDTGSDDAIAIMAAILHPELEVIGITTVCGNQPLENTTENTLRVVDLLGVDVPVYRGCAGPMVAELNPNRQAHSQQSTKSKEIDGKKVEIHSEYLNIPPSKTKEQERRAVSYLIDILMASDGDIILIPVGPLTNIGTAMIADPRIKKKIKQIVIMGGGHHISNNTSAAEFNIWKDPEAAQIVFTSGCNVILVPLDATHEGYVTSSESAKIRAMNTPASIAVADLLDQRINAYKNLQPLAVEDSTPPHDALAVLAAVDESVLENVQFRHVDVDFSGGIADGRTVVDDRPFPVNPPNVRIALGCNREKFVKMLMDTIALSK
ncbi:MAG: nucleoside hydrolase [Anaerolineaceae bacterium]|nr:nucleoside hydrolase [Anaerolineaceae bacterium]